MRRSLITAAAALATAVAVPAVADAATIHQDGKRPHRFLLQDTTGDANLVTVSGSKHIVFQDINAPIKIGRAPTCMPLDVYTVRCSNVGQIDLDLGDGTDYATIETSVPVDLEGGAGRDRYNAVTAGPSRVKFSGGIGLDTASYAHADTGVTVGVDLLASDGRPGDGDNILRDVENVVGSQYDDVLNGSDRTLQLEGLDGADHITGGSEAVLLSGGWGSDHIEARDGAADAVDCGGQLFDRAFVDAVEASITRCAEVAF